MWTVPNILSSARLVAAPLLIVLAMTDRQYAFAALACVLLIDDWLDGKLAVWLKQQTTFGARLDSAADAALYACILCGLIRLRGSFLWSESPWILGALATYLATTAFGLIKYGRIPAYHTRGAKISWLLTSIAVMTVCLKVEVAAWPLRAAMAAVMVTNLEAIAMTRVLPEWHADVLSLRGALRLAKESGMTRLPDR